MRLKKASAWYHNTSNRDIVIDELGIKIGKQSVIDLFQKNPFLQYDKYLSSMRDGVLFQKRDVLKPLAEKPHTPEPIRGNLLVSDDMRASFSKSVITIGKEEKDWIDNLEEEFPANAQPLTQEEAWRIERQKVLKNLDLAETGENGEVFADVDFDMDEGDDSKF